MRKNLNYGVIHAMRAFIRVVDSGSFTAAANQMALTTAQISRLVSDLESRLQTKLLQRTTRRLSLTPAGERYADRCRQIIELMAEAEDEAGGGSVEPIGSLRVRCMASFGHRYIEPLVSKYCLLYPKVTIEYSTSQNLPDLIGDAVDVSIYLSQHLVDSSLIAQRLGTTYRIVCATPSYIARHGTPLHPLDLAKHACLRLFNPSVNRQWELTDGETRHVIDVTGPLIGETPDVVLNAVLQGVGIAMLPAYAAIDGLRDGSLVRLLGAFRSPEIGVYALYPSRRFMEAKTRAWLDLLNEEVQPALVEDKAFLAKNC